MVLREISDVLWICSFHNNKSICIRKPGLFLVISSNIPFEKIKSELLFVQLRNRSGGGKGGQRREGEGLEGARMIV